MLLSDVAVESVSRPETTKWQQFGLSGAREDLLHELNLLLQREWHAFHGLRGSLCLCHRARVMLMLTFLGGRFPSLEQPCWHLRDLTGF